MQKKRNTKFRTSDLAAILICIAGFSTSIFFFSRSLNQSLKKSSADEIATITFKYRSAQRRLADRVVWDRLQNNSPVYNGDIIRTADLSEATIYFVDGNRMDLHENTLVQISSGGKRRGTAIAFEFGSIEFETASNVETAPFTVTKGTTTLVLRADTAVKVEAAPRAAHADLRVEKGTVDVVIPQTKTDGQQKESPVQQQVTAGQSVRIASMNPDSGDEISFTGVQFVNKDPQLAKMLEQVAEEQLATTEVIALPEEQNAPFAFITDIGGEPISSDASSVPQVADVVEPVESVQPTEESQPVEESSVGNELALVQKKEEPKPAPVSKPKVHNSENVKVTVEKENAVLVSLDEPNATVQTTPSAVPVAAEKIPATETGYTYVKGGSLNYAATGAHGTVDSLIVSSKIVTPPQIASLTKVVEGSETWFAAIAYCNMLSTANGFTPVYTIRGSKNPDAWDAMPDGQVTLPTSADDMAVWGAVKVDANADGYRLPTENEWLWINTKGGAAVQSETSQWCFSKNVTNDAQRMLWKNSGTPESNAAVPSWVGNTGLRLVRVSSEMRANKKAADAVALSADVTANTSTAAATRLALSTKVKRNTFSVLSIWKTQDDSTSGGKSATKVKSSGVSFQNEVYAGITFTGAVRKSSVKEYIVSLYVNGLDVPDNMISAKNLKFKVIGDGNAYLVRIRTNAGWFESTFVPPAQGVASIDLPYTALKPAKGTKSDTLDPKKIVGFGFAPVEPQPGNYTITLFDINPY